MSSEIKPLAVFGAIRLVSWARFEIYESLYFTSDKLFVARSNSLKPEKTASFSPEQVLSDKNNFAIPYSEVERVELKKALRTIQIKVHAGEQKLQWNVKFMSGNEFLDFDDVKRVLKQFFDWKLDAPEEF